MKNKLIIYTGMDGCGKSTKFKKLKHFHPEWKFLYEPEDWRNKPVKDLIKYYQQYDVLDRCFLLDEIVYSQVWNDESKITKEESLKILESLGREVEINIGVNTYIEYTFIHKYRNEKDFPEYYSTLKEWSNLIYFFQHSQLKNVKVNVFWFDKKLKYNEFVGFYIKEVEGRYNAYKE